MMNDEGKVVDLYIPRKCSATSRLIPANEHGAIQINIGKVDEAGRYTGEHTTFAISGAVRQRAESDASLNKLFHSNGMLSFAN